MLIIFWKKNRKIFFGMRKFVLSVRIWRWSPFLDQIILSRLRYILFILTFGKIKAVKGLSSRTAWCGQRADANLALRGEVYPFFEKARKLIFAWRIQTSKFDLLYFSLLRKFLLRFGRAVSSLIVRSTAEILLPLTARLSSPQKCWQKSTVTEGQ